MGIMVKTQLLSEGSVTPHHVSKQGITMKSSIRYIPILLVLLTTVSHQLSTASAQGTAFS
jgi:hypothetical protein